MKPLRRMTVGCSSTPATECVRRSLPRALPSTRRWPPSVSSSCRYGWASPPVRRTSRRRLLRSGAQSRRAGDGVPDTVVRSCSTARRPCCSAELISSRWAIGGYVIIAKPVDLFQVRADGLRASSPPEDTRSGAWKSPAATTSFVGRESELAELESTASRRTGWSRSPVLAGWVRPGSPSKLRARWRPFPDGVWVIELAAGRRSCRGAGRCRGGTGHHPAARHELWPTVLRQHWKAGHGC